MEEEFRTSDYLFNKYEINRSGTIIRNIETKHPLKIKTDKHHCSDGYDGHNITFIHIGGRSAESKIKRIPIGRAVLECWVGKQPEGMEVDHWNRNSLDDNLENLRYVTKSEQMKNRDYSQIAKQGANNLHNARMSRAIGVALSRGDTTLNFDSVSECSRFLSEESGISKEKIRYYLRAKVDNYLGYQITYIESKERVT